MSFAEDFQKAERKALVENTAQDIFNILKDLVFRVTRLDRIYEIRPDIDSALSSMGKRLE